MAEKQTEELNEGQAIVALQQYMLTYQFMGKMNDVLKHYERAKAEIPELDKSRAEKAAEIVGLEEKIANLKTHCEESEKEWEQDFAERKAAADKEQSDKAAVLTGAITDLNARKAAKEKEADKAIASAEEKIKAAEARAKEAEEKADAALADVAGRVTRAEAEYQAVQKKLVALRASIGEVTAQ